MELPNGIRGMPVGEVISRISTLNDGIRDFWSAAHGWAPADAADLLARARLDRQASLSSCLSFWTEEFELPEQRDGALVLGWANLGALVEGTMKWFLCVYREDYPDDETTFRKNGKLLEPDALKFDQLRRFFTRHVWSESERDDWDQWLARIRDRRNSIHSYQDRDIGDQAALHQAIREYLTFLRDLHDRIPGYPDEGRSPMSRSTTSGSAEPLVRLPGPGRLRLGNGRAGGRSAPLEARGAAGSAKNERGGREASGRQGRQDSGANPLIRADWCGDVDANGTEDVLVENQGRRIVLGFVGLD